MANEICCGAFVIENGKVLMIQNKNGLHWDFPKGHQEKGETKEETAIREVFEETGIQIELLSKKAYINEYDTDKGNHKMVYFYEAKPIGGTLQRQETEILAVEWVDQKEAITRITFDSAREAYCLFLRKKEQRSQKENH